MRIELLGVLCFALLQAAYADDQQRELLGCGTLVSIRPVNQKPFPNYRNSKVVETRSPGSTVNENPRSKLRGIGYRHAIRLTSFRRKGERPKGLGIYPT